MTGTPLSSYDVYIGRAERRPDGRQLPMANVPRETRIVRVKAAKCVDRIGFCPACGLFHAA